LTAGTWALDSVSSGQTPDTSGNNNAGTVTGPYNLGAGRIGQAIQLDAAAGGIVTQRGVIDPTKSYTVALWVKLVQTGGTQTFVSLPAGSVSNFYLQLGGWLNGGFVMDVYPGDSTATPDYAAASTTIPVAGQWYHVTGVFDAASKEVRVYVNGQLEGAVPAPGGGFANAGPLAFGYSKWAGKRYDGNDAWLDDVRVFDSALSDAEILGVYEGTGAGPATAPVVSLTAPVNGASFVAPAAVSLTASATTTQGTITKVEFFNGAALLGTSTAAPYGFSWANVAAGSYTLTAKATGSNGTTTTSAPVTVTVTAAAAPVVSLTAPANGASFVAPAAVSLTASATTTQGTITKVEFFNGAALLGTSTAAPYGFSWANVAAGSYTLTAKATGSNGTTTTSAPVTVTVAAAAAPVVSLTAPANGASFVAPAAVSLTASATTTQGTITKVEFFNGATLLSSDSAAPYAFNWTNVAAGSYTLTAKATGSNGTTTTSAAVTVTVTAAAAPVVSLTAPANGASFVAPAAVSLTASATTTQGTITKVEFFNGATLLSSDTAAPYAFNWTNVAAGSYTLTAKATGSNGTTTTSAPVTVTVTAAAAPVVSLTAPVNGASFVAPAAVSLTASATTTQGTITKVEFFNGATLLSSDTAAPYAFNWTNVAAGSYTLTAKATGSNGTTTTSAPVTVTVTAAAAPVVSLTAPTTGASFVAPAAVALTASATTTQGTITKVEFFNGTTLLGSATAAPYAFNWTNVAAGSYTLTAKATGSNGLSTTSAAASVTVTVAGGGGAPAAVGRWPLDSVTAGQTPDTSGNNNGGLVTGPYNLAAATLGQGIQLDPAIGGILTQRPVIDPTKSYTVSVWVKLAQTAGTQTFVSLPGVSVSNFYLQLGGWLHGGFVMDVYPADSTASPDYVAASTTIPLANRWYHLTGVFDTAEKKVRLYVDGRLESEVDAPGGSFANSGPLAFGYSKWAGVRYDGNDARLDDVRVFNSALTAAQVQAVFASR
jgi:PKD repeat protein